MNNFDDFSALLFHLKMPSQFVLAQTFAKTGVKISCDVVFKA